MIVEAPSTTQPAASESVGIDPNQSATTPQQPTYILQVRSYNDPDQADARRAEIILNGLSADVIKSENGQTWYRVISGPYDTQDAALLLNKHYNIAVLIL
jgi:cell division protein FtsN